MNSYENSSPLAGLCKNSERQTLLKQGPFLSPNYHLANGHDQGALSAAKFYNHYKRCLPMNVKLSYQSGEQVVETHCSVQSSLQEHVIELQLEDDGRSWFTVPSNRDIQVGLLFKPHGACWPEDSVKGVKGVTFDTVEKLTAQPTLPKFVCASRSCFCGSTECSVVEGELLLVHKCTQTKVNLFKMDSHRILHAFSLTYNQKKKLPAHCAGGFTTNPQLTKLHLDDLYRHLPGLHSTSALLFPKQNSILIPHHLSSKVVTVTSRGIGVCLQMRLLGSSTEGMGIISLPIAASVTLKAVEFNSRILPIPPLITPPCNPFNMNVHDEYVTMSHNTTVERRMEGRIEVEAPDPEDDAVIYEGGDAVSTPDSGDQQACVNLTTAISEEGTEITKLRQMVEGLQMQCNQYEARLNELEVMQRKTEENFSIAIQKLSLQIRGMSQMQLSGSPVGLKQSCGLGTSRSVNNEVLKKLGVDQVLQLLEAMGLSEYKDVFEKEGICGAVLSEIDDPILDLVLGITTEQHRSRIMKVISGAVSVEEFGISQQ